MKKYDVLAIGELNVDLILNHIDGEAIIGKEKFARNMTLTLGSSTAIFAANTATLGIKVAFVGMIGQDSFGELIKSELKTKGVDTSFLIENKTLSTGASIILNYGEDRAMITYQGAMEYMGLDDIEPEAFEQCKHVHLSAIFNQHRLQQDLHRLLIHARDRGITTSVDTQWDPSEKWDFDYKKLLPLITVFMPNDKELMAITSSENLDEAIEKIKPYINSCIIKSGSNGSLLCTRDGEQKHLPAFLNPSPVDAIGAGDSFNAGFISRFVKGASLQECQYTGNLMGAISTTAAGGTGAFSNGQKVIETACQKFNQKITL